MEHEYIAIVPEIFESDRTMTVGVDKAGGGTLGSYYEGDWMVHWYEAGELRATDKLTTGTAKRHDQVAAMAGQFWTDHMDTEEDWPTFDRVQYWAQSVLGD